MTTVNGDLVILSTGTSAQEFRLTGNTNFTLSLAGSLIISGGVLDLANGTGAPTINIGGDFSQSGGTFKSSGSVSTVAFTGANKTFTQSAGTFTTSNIDFTVATGASLTLANDLPVATSRSLTVNGTLNTGTNAVTGAGAFTLASGATLGIGSAGGINSGTSQGNIRVSGTRTFNNGANYIFNGASDQVLGNGFSTTMNNLTIANAGITTNDRANLTVNGNLVVNAGSTFDLSTYSVTSVGGTVTNNGTLKQTKTVAASGTTSFLTIPTAKYYGVDITAGTTALGSTTVAVSGNQVCSQASGYPVKRCFEITPASQQSANIKFYFTNAQMQTDQTLSSLNVWHYNGSTWDSITKGTTGGTSSCGNGAIDCFVEGTGITSYSPFALKNTSPQAVTLADFSAAQSGDAVLLTWETNSELENRGFNLYRGTDPAAPDRQLNDALIPSQSQGNPGGFIYTWEDRADLTPGTTYYYWVEDVDIYGAATRHGPVSVDYGAPTAVRLVDAGAVTALPWAMPLAAVGLLALAALAAVGRRR